MGNKFLSLSLTEKFSEMERTEICISMGGAKESCYLMESYTTFKIEPGLKPSLFYCQPLTLPTWEPEKRVRFDKRKSKRSMWTGHLAGVRKRTEVCLSSSIRAAWLLCKWDSRCPTCRGSKLRKALRNEQISTVCLGETEEASTVALWVSLSFNDYSTCLTGLLWGGFIDLYKMLRTKLGIENLLY